MSLADCFENTEGTGVLATADAQGNVDLALYARPHVVSDDEVIFIMGDHVSHNNITVNPHAAYLFLERGEPGRGQEGPGYKGVRLYLTRTTEEADPQKIEALRRKGRKGHESDGRQKFLVYFKVDRTRRLVGD